MTSSKRSSALQARLDTPLLVATLLTIPAILVEESSAGSSWQSAAQILNWAIWVAFLVEAIVMLWAVDDRWGWIRAHPLEVAILILTPPFLPSALQAARVFRLLRLLRLFKAAALTRRLLSTQGVVDAAVLAVVAVLGGGAAFAAVEKTDAHGHVITAWDGVWWAMTTVTTVGYGDYSPRTDAGRCIAIVVMLVGIGFVAVLTAAAAERFVKTSATAEAERREILDRLDELSERLAAIEPRANS